MPMIRPDSRPWSRTKVGSAVSARAAPHVNNSASASELVSSSLRDLRGARLVGTHTYGKQIGQTTYPLSSGGAVKLTTFRYYTKSGVNYQDIGLTPDVEVHLSEEKARYLYALSPSEDDVYLKAKEILLNELKGE